MRLNKNVDMTNGPLLGKMIAYTIPIILSGWLQLLYNAADLVVIGQFGPPGAFAAVGANGALYSLFTNVFFALAGGGCICVAQYYGAREGRNVHETVHTCMLISIVGGFVVAVVGIIFAKGALELMGTHPDIIDMAALYLRIVFASCPFTMFFNFAAGILRATGDTKRPFYILTLTGFVNVLLNLILVIFFDMSVAGVGIATFVANVLNAVLTGYILVKSDDSIRLNFKELKIYGDKLKKILNYGIPSAVNSIMFSVSNVLIQSAVNSFNSVAVISGNTASASVEGFIYTAMNSIAQTTLNFTGQNYGARKYKRISRVLLNSFVMVTMVGGSLGIISNIFGTQLLRIYEPTDDLAIEKGLIRLSIIGTLYFICGINEVYQNIMRGIGASWTPTVVSFVSVVGLRIVWVLFVFPLHHTLEMLYVAWPITWISSTLILMVMYLLTRKKHYARNEAQYAQQE